MNSIDQQIEILYKYMKHMKCVGNTPEDSFVDLCRMVYSYRYENLSEKETYRLSWNENMLLGIKTSFDMRIFSRIYDQFINMGLREQTGSFYTPEYIIEYMVEEAITKYLVRTTDVTESKLLFFLKEEQFGHLSIYDLLELQETLKKLKIIDIACGTGLFLIVALEKVFSFRKKINLCLGIETEDFLLKKEIVEENIFGMDIQQHPLEIARYVLLSMILDEKKSDLQETIQLNLRKANSLLEEELFQKEWPRSFDIVIGNPPYLGEKGNRNVFLEIRDTTFGRKYYEGKMDYFYFFIYRALELLEDQGILSYITTNYFVTADGASKLRNYLKEHTTFLQIVNFNHTTIFQDAKGQHNMIFLLSKGKEEKGFIVMKCFKNPHLSEDHIKEKLYQKYGDDKNIDVFDLDVSQLFTSKNHIVIQGNREEQCLLEKLENCCDLFLEEICHVNQGIVTGADKVTKNMLDNKFSQESINRYDIQENEGIFVLKEEEVLSLGLETSPFIKPMFKNSDISNYSAKNTTNKYILYVNDLYMLHRTEEEYEKVICHLSRYKEVLIQRREVLKGLRSWYAIQWPRQPEIFEKAKIVVPHRAKDNKFAFTEVPWYASADVYYITSKEKYINFKSLLAQLNSNLMYFWLYHRGKRKGVDLELYANPLNRLPIRTKMTDKIQNELEKRIDRILKTNCTEDRKAIDLCLYKAYGLKPNEIQWIETLCKENRKV
ncbi:Eco57I restriction-modification methylase domain-containing protein [Geosporobacter ferrireducens]|uniref:site-specific DNA-methyltransferase (adenine-specific) n=1 Tax=Geosporobacter ferrireducens TaxID=1424294 RepID=A0A1D8GCB5_9FIRM|nr:DNA methyltransferase [Geosporobacter ferrireducens]AOT68554.1 hypothetical protein Gferi_02455 [Geosporobacter ferrireducens]MTI54019.1 hypothetical protein [Geosporobacter ferrireducens]